MSRAVLTIAVEGPITSDPLGIKEAAVMALEHLGWAKVTRVEVEDEEQLSVLGEAKRPPRAVSVSVPTSAPAPAPIPPRPADKPKSQTAMECCFSCACYRSEPGRDAAGMQFWGVCGRTGQAVYDLKNRCGGWAPLGSPRVR